MGRRHASKHRRLCREVRRCWWRCQSLSKVVESSSHIRQRFGIVTHSLQVLSASNWFDPVGSFSLHFGGGCSSNEEQYVKIAPQCTSRHSCLGSRSLLERMDDTDCGSQAEPSETREFLEDQIDVVVLPPPLLVLVSPYTIESNTVAGVF